MFNEGFRLSVISRVQREQILAEPGSGLDPGPPEAAFSLDPAELREETEKELLHLRQDKARLEARLQEARQQVASKQRIDLLLFCLLSVCARSGEGGRLFFVSGLPSPGQTVFV